MSNERKLILTICTGNVCRSPMAEKLLQHGLRAQGAPYDQIEVASAGVAAVFDDPASANSVAAVKKVQLDLTHHKSQPVTQSLIDQAFAIFGMTQSHIDLLHHYHSNLPEHLYLFREFIGEGADPEIPDPFGQSLRVYSASLDSMAEAIPSLVKKIKSIYPA